MTSADFATVLIESIIVDRPNRQRRELTQIEELAESIKAVGLINPPVVTREHILIAGERRFTACRSLGWTSIPVQYADTLDPEVLHLIELEENAKRVDLTWRDHNDAISQYHALRSAADPEWSRQSTAKALNISDSAVGKHLRVAEAINAGNAAVADAPKLSTAIGIATRSADRKAATATAAINTEILQSIGAEDTPELPLIHPTPQADPTRAVEIRHASFLDFAQRPLAQPYNLLHCDFPYGVNAGDKQGQSAAKSHGHYEDTADVYFELLAALCGKQDNFIAPSAHLMFWYSMDYHTETVDLLTAAGWNVNPFPLIWFKNDNKGILPDANRGPRRIYETALFASRGDRKIVRAVGNCVPAPVTKNYHQAEKPLAVLEHFFRMLVDETTHLLDPTCGSGMAVRAAEACGAASALGLEKEAEFAAKARHNLSLPD